MGSKTVERGENDLLKCSELCDLDRFLENLTPVIGKGGGRFFKANGENGEGKRYRLNGIVRHFQKIHKDSPSQPDLSKRMIKKIRDLDVLADDELAKKSGLIRLLTCIRQLFGNLFFNREKVLSDIGAGEESNRRVDFREARVRVFDREHWPRLVKGINSEVFDIREANS